MKRSDKSVCLFANKLLFHRSASWSRLSSGCSTISQCTFTLAKSV